MQVWIFSTLRQFCSRWSHASWEYAPAVDEKQRINIEKYNFQNKKVTILDDSSLVLSKKNALMSYNKQKNGLIFLIFIFF